MSGESAQVKQEVQDCAVCLQKCHYPTQLPCGHIFCFLCVKGVAIQNKKCAMCRADIPPDYLDHPVLLEKVVPTLVDTQATEEFQWYYEGRNGWWKYDQRSNAELEAAFNAGDGQCKLLLAGAVYVIDFQSMLQVQSRDTTRRRRVKRDTPTLPAKGIAGIKITDNTPRQPTKSESEESHNTSSHNNSADSDVEVIENEVEIIEIEDDNAVVSSEIHHVLGDVIERISSIDLQEQVGNELSRDFSPTEDT
ncbi:hypothetical protein O0L34_g18371 [Tuta absoluta]|nr:hypothetical protein O0L34_g18371 [Tuta absoluta]